MLRKFVAVLLVLVMLGSAVMPAMATTNTVSQNEAKSVANKFIARISATDSFKDWKYAKIGKIATAYDVDESRSAYILELVKDGKYAGYIVVSAKKTNYPILEFSKGKSPLARIEELGIKAERVYRLGGMMYIAEERGKYYDLNKREIDFSKLREGVVEALKDEKIRNHLAKRTMEAKKQWEKYSSETLGGTQPGEGHVFGVPALLWYLGCSPTAAAMVLGYWDQHGYPNFPNDYQHDLIEELADAMGLTCWYLPPWWQGTCPTNIDDGINEVCNNHGYSNWATNQWFPTWNDVVNEITAGRPFVLAMAWGGTGSGHTQPYGHHSVTCIGFLTDYSTNEKFVELYDTWDTTPHLLAFGDWWASSATWVRP
ncbi:MAG: C39 family peptidase [Archaeoglobus sp.]|nr:C39 family peptidase [Archaeoglobus sp.]